MHGYAATFHKSQGVTVDRAHVLARPGMDRHSGYVGLSRHREGVQLHYGRDDFADQCKLARVLSRDRGKDMAGDYAPDRSEQDHARAFAERREIWGEIRFPELARQVVENARDKVRGMFDGFKPKPTLADHVEAATRQGADKPVAPAQGYPYLTKLYDAVMRERRDDRIRTQEQERERARQRDKERGRDDYGRGR